MQSTITSYCCIMVTAFWAVIPSSCRIIVTAGFSLSVSVILMSFYFFKALSAEFVFGSPIVAVLCRTCLCKFDRSTKSLSAIPMVPVNQRQQSLNIPIPAPTRYRRAGQPNPPAPITSTEAPFRDSCPGSPILGSIICRPYRMYS